MFLVTQNRVVGRWGPSYLCWLPSLFHFFLSFFTIRKRTLPITASSQRRSWVLFWKWNPMSNLAVLRWTSLIVDEVLPVHVLSKVCFIFIIICFSGIEFPTNDFFRSAVLSGFSIVKSFEQPFCATLNSFSCWWGPPCFPIERGLFYFYYH